MRADYLSYKRAVGVCFIGVAIQAGIGLLLLLYSVYARVPAAMTPAIGVFIGVIVWLVLAILFDQHRRERIEAMEDEALAAAPEVAASAFEGTEELKIAARRLGAMNRFLVPITSLLIAGAYIVVGVWRFSSGSKLLEDTVEDPKRGWGIAVGLAAAVIGFIFARFVSGMGKQAVWSNLRAGAAQAVAAALYGLALVVGHFVDVAGPDAPLRYLNVIYPAMLVLLGAEVVLNFLLNLYRPRHAGETPRPAFDSRVLGFVAAPDRIAESISEAINYQLGYDVTSGWFYQLLRRWLLWLVAGGVLIMWLMTSGVVLRPHQTGMILRFGEPVRVVGSGLSLKLPWPIEAVQIPEFTAPDKDSGRVRVTGRTTTGVRVLQVSGRTPSNAGAILWTNEHGGDETYSIVQLGSTGEGGSTIGLVSAQIELHYVVADVEKFDRFCPPEFRDARLRGVAEREVTLHLSPKSVDELLGAERPALAKELRERIARSFDSIDAGVEVVFVGLGTVHPPQEVAPEFENVIIAEHKRHTELEQARGEQIQTLTEIAGSVDLAERIVGQLDELDDLRSTPGHAPMEQELQVQSLVEQAGGRASVIISEARADRWTEHMGQRSRAVRHSGQLASFTEAPGVFRARLYFDALRESLSGVRLYITSDDVENLRVDTDLSQSQTGADVFDPTAGNPAEE